MTDLKLMDNGTLDNGSQVWVNHPELAWAPGTVIRTDNDLLVVKVDDGLEVKITSEHAENHSVHKSSLEGIPNLLVLGDYCEGALLHNVRTRYYQDKIYTCIGNLILISINPYKHISDLYGEEQLNLYKNGIGDSDEQLPPHIFKMAQNAYDALFTDGKNQSIIITGESGAGKTEATKIILCYLANIQKSTIGKALDENEIMRVNATNNKRKQGFNLNTSAIKSSLNHSSQSSLSSVSFDDSSVESLVLRSNPILEAFGNAKTIRNDNSSRFGKFIEIFFDSTGKLKGASIANYLLEKCRLTTQQEGERNYHIFYCLIEAALNGILPDSLTDELNITHKDEFYIVKEAIDIPGRNECGEMEQVIECLKCIGLTEQEIFEILRICTGILHLCNFSFQQESTNDAPGVVEEEISYFETSSKLLKLNGDSLLSVFQWKKLKDPETGRIIKIPVSLEAAFQTRDSMAKAIYSKLFDWLVFRINKSMTNGLINNNAPSGGYSASDKKVFSGKSIGLLDIYGFEVFDVNSFEQFCINFSNEKLQQQFNHQMFQEEQQMYQGEGIDWTRINFADNRLIIESLEKKPNGIFPLLDSECLMPQGSDSSFLNKILKLATNSNNINNFGFPNGSDSQKIIYKPSKMSNTSFAVSHYAGPVIYDTRGFLEKNRDQLHSDVTELLLSSESPLIIELFNNSCNEKNSMCKKSSRSSIKREDGAQLTGGGGFVESAGANNNQRPKGILVTVSGAFREQLNGLIDTLNNTSPSYIRCIKPNSRKTVHELDSIDVLRQLKCAGMLESIRIRKSGYSIRRKFVDFYNRYKILYPSIESHDFTGAKNYSLICKMILERLQNELQQKLSDNEKEVWDYSWQIGKTLIFIKDSFQTQLERKLSESCYKYCTMISSCWRMYIVRKRYKLIINSVRFIQSRWRVFTLRSEFLSYFDKRKAAARFIQIKYREYIKKRSSQLAREDKIIRENNSDFVILGSPCKENKDISRNNYKSIVNSGGIDTGELPKNVSKLWEILDSLQSSTEKTSKLVSDKNNEEITNSKLEIESLRDKLGMQESHVGSLESKIKLMESEHKRVVSDFEHKLEISKLSLKNETNKISETYETQKADLNSKILVLEQKNEVEKNRVLYLERLLEQSDKDLAILRKQFSAEIEDRQHEREYYMKETERNRETQQKLQGQITSLEQDKLLNLNKIDEFSKYKQLYEELERENNNLKQELESKNNRITQLELQNSYLDQIKLKSSSSKGLTGNISFIDTVEGHGTFSRSEMSTIEDVTALNSNAIAGIGLYNRYHNNIGGNPQNSQRLVYVENQCSELLEINDQLRENVDILEEDKATLQKRILELFVERRTLVDENKSLNLRVRQKSAQVDALKSTLTELRNTAENSINEIRSEWENCVQRLEATQFALMESTKELDLIKSERDELLACLDDVQHFTEATMKRRQRSFSSNIGIDSSIINSSHQDPDYHQNLIVVPPYEKNIHIQDSDCNINSGHSPKLLDSYRRKNSRGADV
ncbi:myosin-related protein [Cryptosporidium ryanae]|uniref:myosin-related protein n=1 Tax=Cryptosporidium ryanae TaxID=515981 RepID=UPI00351A2EB1|nr:myosin-related protein [Cryptosporidium ryanae]